MGDSVAGLASIVDHSRPAAGRAVGADETVAGSRPASPEKPARKIPPPTVRRSLANPDPRNRKLHSRTFADPANTRSPAATPAALPARRRKPARVFAPDTDADSAGNTRPARDLRAPRAAAPRCTPAGNRRTLSAVTAPSPAAAAPWPASTCDANVHAVRLSCGEPGRLRSGVMPNFTNHIDNRLNPPGATEANGAPLSV